VTTPVHIQAILGSTRQGRFGETVAKWFMSVAEQRDDLTIELLDLRDWPLPFFNHPTPPSSGEIAPEARAWSEKIKQGDGYVFISPEYNRGAPGVLKNALDYLWYEWNNKPVGMVGYGGAAGAARALAQLRLVAMELELAPVRVEVTLVSARRLFDERGNLTEERHTAKVNQMLDQVVAWAHAMQPLRSQG
jgi:NAD(P)H-dependent FMN reductase